MCDQTEKGEQLAVSAEERIKVYLEFSKDVYGWFDLRRTYQWKMNWGLWAATAIFCGFAIQDKLGTRFTANGWIFLGVDAGILLVYIYWASGIHSANRRDRDYAFAYKDAIEEALATCKIAPLMSRVARPKRQRIKCLFGWSAITEVLITAGLLAMTVVVCWNRLEWPQ